MPLNASIRRIRAQEVQQRSQDDHVSEPREIEDGRLQGWRSADYGEVLGKGQSLRLETARRTSRLERISLSESSAILPARNR
jgi:hypothetical protein